MVGARHNSRRSLGFQEAVALPDIRTVLALADGAAGPFHFFGDPTPAGWLLVAAYFLAAWSCFRARRIAHRGEELSRSFPSTDRRRRARAKAYRASCVFWFGLGIAFVIMGVNKQLDAQAWITEQMRELAIAQGWHAQRRIVQSFVVVSLACAGVSGLTVTLIRTRDRMPRHVLAFCGAMLLACFALARMTSFHNLDATLDREVLGVSWYTWIELSGVWCVGWCALLNCRWYVRGRHRGQGNIQRGNQPAGSTTGSRAVME